MQDYRVREAARDWPGEAQDKIQDLQETKDRCEESEKEMSQQYDELMSEQQSDTHSQRRRDKELWDEWKKAKYVR